VDGPRVTALILSRRRVERLRTCLRSVLAQEGVALDVVVLANGCAETAALVRDEFPQVRLVELAENVGCTRGRNRIAREPGADLMLFLDDDGELRERDAVAKLAAAAARDPRAGVVSMALFDAATDQPTGWLLRASRLDFPCYHMSFAGGACLMRRRAFDEAGGYPEAFSGFGEEFDLAVRLYARGWAVLHFPGAAFHHHVAKSDEEWRLQVSEGYAHLQYTLWRLYPWPWWLLASTKALATQLWIDVRHHGGRHLVAEAAKSHVWAHRGGREATPVPVRALELLYFAKYFRVASWDELERAPRGLLRRVAFLRLRRKRLGVPKLPLPDRS
jgi:GT2 family glycosyltransferase